MIGKIYLPVERLVTYYGTGETNVFPAWRGKSSAASIPGSITQACRCTGNCWTNRSKICGALFETNFWGLVYGSLEAAQHFKSRHEAGAIINVGSTLSDRALILQGIYSASKHAVKGFTDALRMELERDGIPTPVTLIQPGAIDTPYPRHAKNYMDSEPTNPPPVYAPETVARTILHCVETPERQVFVGAGGKGIPMLGYYAPRLADLVMESLFARQQQTDRPARPLGDNGLDRPAGDLQERGDYQGYISETSLYTTASLHPLLTGAALVGAGLVLKAFWSSSGNGGRMRP